MDRPWQSMAHIISYYRIISLVYLPKDMKKMLAKLEGQSSLSAYDLIEAPGAGDPEPNEDLEDLSAHAAGEAEAGAPPQVHEAPAAHDGQDTCMVGVED